MIGAILVTINPAYRVHELVSWPLVSQVSILNLCITDENVEPCWSFTLAPSPKYPNVEILKFVGRSVSRDPQLTEG